MAYDNSGILFRNDKGGVESRPDYTGRATVQGDEFELAAWIKQGKKGKFMTISFKFKVEEPQENSDRYAHPAPDDNSVPF